MQNIDTDNDLDNLARTPDRYFKPGSFSQEIFNQNAPYNNVYQTSRTKLLFVCSAGLLRSPTGAYVGAQRGYNTRSCGSTYEYALIPLSANLIMWADKIFFVNPENFEEALITFKNTGFDEDINDKAIVLNIPDQYRAFDPGLIKQYNEVFDQFESKFPDLKQSP